jgi:hypothetical protein
VGSVDRVVEEVQRLASQYSAQYVAAAPNVSSMILVPFNTNPVSRSGRGPSTRACSYSPVLAGTPQVQIS